jgi:hypothetical protein
VCKKYFDKDLAGEINSALKSREHNVIQVKETVSGLNAPTIMVETLHVVKDIDGKSADGIVDCVWVHKPSNTDQRE